MCGIAGKVVGNNAQINLEVLESARTNLEHRGPDGGGIWVNSRRTVGVVHTRLAIVDVSGGQQPIANEHGDVQVVFNGEVYNHIELRATLEGKGHRFRTRCDAEVLVHLYEEYGLELFDHLNGMFAFALWDDREETLVLARDRLGQKPLYYCGDRSELAFASELKALWPLLDRRPDVNPQAVDNFLTLKYIPHELGMFDGIRQLAPGHCLKWSRDSVETSAYWSYPDACPDFDGSFDDAAATLRELLVDATRLRLRSDVPVGVLLSGGIDSALVVGLIAESGTDSIQTFTASFADGPDERPYAAAVAKRFKTDHCELHIEPPSRDLVYKVLDQFDEPFADTSAVPTYLICEQARRHVKVVLTGDGGDESFMGYTRYRSLETYLKQRRWAYPAMRFSGLETLGRMLCPDPQERTIRRRFRTATNFWRPSSAEVYSRWYAAFPQSLKRQIRRERFDKLLADANDADRLMRQQLADLCHHQPIASAAAFDLRHYLPDSVLTKVDRASMAHGLECRSPFLDHRVIEFAARLPVKWRLHPRHGSKWILRMACRDLLPDEVNERSKAGFGAPIGEWLRRDLTDGAASDCVPSNGLERWLDVRVTDRMINEHLEGIEDHSYRLWTLLTLNRFWARNR